MERFNKKKSKELTVNELQHEIAIIKEEIVELKNKFKNIKNDSFNLKQEILLQRIDKQLNNQQFDTEPNKQEEDGDNTSQQTPLSSTVLTKNKLSLINKLIPPKWFS